ncbi:uncharacterized protein PB18E9.04c isoform X2 [Nematostella vectensis]|nr:uncharacterized protein PB18E9.04c isoform X2 [Nematostella vectensis]
MSSPSRILNPEISGFSRNNILTSSMSLGATLVGVLSSEASEVSVFITLPLALETHSLTSHVSVSYQQTMDDPITSDSRKMEKATSLDNTHLATEYLDKPLLEAGNYTQANTGDVTSVSLDWGRPGTSQVDVSNNHPSMTSYALFGSAAASPWSQDFGTSSEYWLMASQAQHLSESTLVRGRGDILISPSYPSALLETTTLITSNQLFNTFIESSTRKRIVSVNRQLTSLYGSPLHNTKDMMSQPLSVSRKGLSYITAHGLITSSLPLYGKYDNPFHTSEGSSSTPMHINSSVKPSSLSVAFKQSVTPGVDKSYSAPRSGNISLALNLASSRTSPLIIDVRTNTASPVVSHRDAQLSSLRVTMSSDIFISQVLVERYPTVLSIVTSSSIGDRLLDFVDSKDSQVTYSSMFWSAHMSGGSTMATPSLTSLPPSTAIDQTSAIPFSESENRKTIEDEDVRTFITSITSIENQYSARLEDRDQSLSSNLSDVMILSLQSVTTNEENRSKTTSSPFGLKSPVSYSLQRYKDSTNKRQGLENILNTEIDSQVILLQTTTSANLKSDMASWSRGSKAILETMMPDALIPAVLSKQSLLYSMKPSTVDEIGAQPVMTATPSCTSPLVSKSQGRLNDSKEITRFGSIVMTSTYTRVSTNGLQSIKTYEDGASHVSFDSEELSGAATSVIKPTTSLLANHTSIKKHSAVVPETRQITEPTKHSSTIAPQSVFLLSNTAEKYTILDFETLSLKVSSPMLSLKSELQISTAMSPMMYSPSLGHTRNTMKELISKTTTSDSTQKATNPLQIINLTKLDIGTTQSTSDIIYVSTTNSPVNSILFWLTTTTVSYPSLHKSRTPSLPSLFSSFHKARTTSLPSVFSSFHKSRTTSLPSLFSSFHKSRTPSLPSLFSSFHKSHTPSLPSLFSSFHKSRTPSLLSLFSSLHKARTTSLPSLFSSLPHPPPSLLPSRVFSPPFSSFPTFSSPISLSSFSSFISHTPYITPPSSSMSSGSSQQTSIPTVQYTRIDGSLKLTNVEFHPNLTNTANVMFKTLAEDVERTIAAIYSSSFIPAQEVKVESFEKGSVVVYFYVMLDSRVAGYYSSEKLTSVLRMSNATMWRGYRVSDVTMVERAAKPQSAKRESSGVDDGVTIAIVLGFICSAVLLCIVIYMLCSHKKRLRKGKVLPVSTNDYGKDETKVPRSQNAWIHEPQFVENESAGEWITLATKGNYAQEEIQDPTKDNRLALEKDHKDTYSTLATYPGNSQSTLEEDYVSSDPTAAASHTNARVTLDMSHTAPVEEVITATREQHHYNANDIDFDQMFAPSAKLVTFLEETESPSLKDGQVRASISDHVMPIKPIQAWFDVVPLGQMGSQPSEEQVSVTDLEQKVGIERKLNKLRQREIIRRESQRQALAEQKATPLY